MKTEYHCVKWIQTLTERDISPIGDLLILEVFCSCSAMAIRAVVELLFLFLQFHISERWKCVCVFVQSVEWGHGITHCNGSETEENYKVAARGLHRCSCCQ